MDADEETLLNRLRLLPDDVEAEIELGALLLKEGRCDDGVAALRRALAIQPGNIDARRALAFFLHHDRRFDEAEAVLRDWQQYDPETPVPRHMLAAFSGKAVPARAADDYIELMFDRIAAEFDEHIASLGYRGPQLVAEAVAAALDHPTGTLDILDAGCGTGLCGPALRPYARRLVGVDLSGGMLAEATRRGNYDHLERSELTAFMTAHAGTFDAVVSADTLIYFGDLGPPLSAAAAALRPDGYLVCTLEMAQASIAETQLNPHGRYSHTEGYVRRVVAEAGLRLCSLTSDALRNEHGQPVYACVITAQNSMKKDGRAQ